MSVPPQRSTVCSTIRATSPSEETSTVKPTPSVNEAAASSAPWTIATLPSSAPLIRRTSPTLQHSVARSSADRRERRRHHDPVPLRVEERLQPAEERLPALVGLQLGAAALALAVALVAPQADHGRE